MFNRAWVLVALVALAGCGEAPEAQQADPVTAPAPAPLDPSLLVGCWSLTSTAGTYGLVFDGGGTMTYAGVKSNGNPIGYAGTWSADVNRLVVTSPTWTSALSYDYSVDSATLALTPFVPAGSVASTYQRVACH